MKILRTTSIGFNFTIKIFFKKLRNLCFKDSYKRVCITHNMLSPICWRNRENYVKNYDKNYVCGVGLTNLAQAFDCRNHNHITP